MTAQHTVDATPSPFATAHDQLTALGFVVIPLISPHWTQHQGRGKCPGEYRSGWSGMSKWQRYRDETPSSFQLNVWSKAPDANAGLILGTSLGRGLHVVAIDFDATDPDVLDTLLRSAPASPMVKRGAKGETRFYLAAKTIKTRSYDGPDGRLVDLLTGFDTRQTVVPPSVHPNTMQPYVWTAGPVRAADLPILTAEDIEALEEVLEQCGWERGGRGPAQRERRPVPGVINDGDPFEVAKAAALANLDAWVPDLPGLYGLRRARGGFEAVDTTRSSSSGRPVESRKRNLSVNPTGIKDFGTNETFSAIDLVMRLVDCSEGEALEWLEQRLGLGVDDSVVIDLAPRLAEAGRVPPWRQTPGNQGFSAGVAEMETPPAQSKADMTEGAGVLEGPATVAVPRATPTHTESAEVPAHLLDCPGLVGDLAAWIERTAHRPLPAANLLTALAVVGTAAGRKFAGPTEAGLVIYGLGLAPSGSGKAHPIRAAQHIMRAAGMGPKIAPSSWMSGSALVQHLGRHPACVTFADEVGELFAKLGGAKASTHERAISGLLRELFGINWGSYTTPGWASSNAASSAPPVIHAPAYSFIGYSVPEAVWEAMQGSDITNGFLNRFLLLPTVNAGAERDAPESVFDVPDALVDALRGINEAGGALATATMHMDMASKPLVNVPWDGGPTGKAARLFKELRNHCREHPQGEHLMKRTAEIAIRLATIRAIGRDGIRASVTLQDMDWGRNLATFSAERMIADADAYMSETDWQQKCLSVLRIIRQADGGAMTKTALYRKLNHKYPARDVKAITDSLKETGQVRENSVRTGERGPASITYVAV